jgi:hypothetical protein
MIAAANSYFDGLETHDGSVILAHPGCFRIENGRALTGRAPFTDCTASLERVQIQATVARRFPVVDEEAGVVLGMVVFIRPPGVKIRRNLLNEWFIIANNRISGIEASMYFAPPEAPLPNWPPYEGNWPLPSRFDAETNPGGAPAAATPAP